MLAELSNGFVVLKQRWRLSCLPGGAARLSCAFEGSAATARPGICDGSKLDPSFAG